VPPISKYIYKISGPPQTCAGCTVGFCRLFWHSVKAMTLTRACLVACEQLD
jgi:hypothetical protein